MALRDQLSLFLAPGLLDGEHSRTLGKLHATAWPQKEEPVFSHHRNSDAAVDVVYLQSLKVLNDKTPAMSDVFDTEAYLDKPDFFLRLRSVQFKWLCRAHPLDCAWRSTMDQWHCLSFDMTFFFCQWGKEVTLGILGPAFARERYKNYKNLQNPGSWNCIPVPCYPCSHLLLKLACLPCRSRRKYFWISLCKMSSWVINHGGLSEDSRRCLAETLTVLYSFSSYW